MEKTLEMEDNRGYYFRATIVCLFLGLFVASFSQSCSTNKASANKLLLPLKNYTNKDGVGTYLKPSVPSLAKKPIVDSTKGLKVVGVLIQAMDTTNYNKKILENQQLSLLNEKKILELLMQKEIENNKLKKVNVDLSKKSVVSKDEKVDAISMKAIWDMGLWLLTASFGVIMLLMLQNFLLLLWISRRSKLNLS